MSELKKFTITACVTFEVEADSSWVAANLAFNEIEFHHPTPENIQVWDQEPGHWFADRFTYSMPPVLMTLQPALVPTVWTDETVAAAVGVKVIQ